MDGPVYKLEHVVHSREGMEDFEGPLDLILFLLGKNKIEIQDIPIALILEQYLAYLEQRQQMEKEIAEHKLALQAEALANVNVKEDAIVEEVRAFAEQNPEITANLVRSLLKEEK